MLMIHPPSCLEMCGFHNVQFWPLMAQVQGLTNRSLQEGGEDAQKNNNTQIAKCLQFCVRVWMCVHKQQNNSSGFLESWIARRIPVWSCCLQICSWKHSLGLFLFHKQLCRWIIFTCWTSWAYRGGVEPLFRWLCDLLDFPQHVANQSCCDWESSLSFSLSRALKDSCLKAQPRQDHCLQTK